MLTRLTASALLILGFLTSPLLAQDGSRLQKILESGTLRVGTTGDFNPMSFKDPGTNEYQGFDIDVAKQFAADMEVEIEFVATDWKTLVNGVVADKYDLTTSASLSMARAKVAGYSDAYVEFGTVPMALKENVEQFDGWDSINNGDTTVAVTLGTVFEAQARGYFPDAEIISVEAPARDRAPARRDGLGRGHRHHGRRADHPTRLRARQGEGRPARRRDSGGRADASLGARR